MYDKITHTHIYTKNSFVLINLFKSINKGQFEMRQLTEKNIWHMCDERTNVVCIESEFNWWSTDDG